MKKEDEQKKSIIDPDYWYENVAREEKLVMGPHFTDKNKNILVNIVKLLKKLKLYILR